LLTEPGWPVPDAPYSLACGPRPHHLPPPAPAGPEAQRHIEAGAYIFCLCTLLPLWAVQM